MNPLMSSHNTDNTDLFIADIKRLANPEARIREVLEANPNLRINDPQRINEILTQVAKEKGIDLNRVYAAISNTNSSNTI